MDMAKEAYDRWQGILDETFGADGPTLIGVRAHVDRSGAVRIVLLANDGPDDGVFRFVPFYDQAGVDADDVERDPDAYCVSLGGATDAECFDWQAEELD